MTSDQQEQLIKVPEHQDGVRFGRTLLRVNVGNPVDQPVEALVCPANRRGVMGVGAAGAIRLAGGAEIEREIMQLAPLTMGSAHTTSSGVLAARGIRYVIHGVVSNELGSPSREDVVRRATVAALQQADRIRVKSVAFPALGAGLGPDKLTSQQVSLVMIEEIVAHVRRFTSRIDMIVLLCRDQREARTTHDALLQARVLWLGIRGGIT
ncbi:MAG: macro domain-containing protein [Thermomicrobiales bacterium]